MSNLPFGFVPTPIHLFKYLQLETLSQTEIRVLSYIIEHSLNFQRGGRAWVAISPAQFAIEFNINAKTVQRSLSRLVQVGIIEDKKEAIKTSGGTQLGRAFRLSDNQKIGELCLRLSAKNTFEVGTREYPPVVNNFSKVGTSLPIPWDELVPTLGLASTYLGGELVPTFACNTSNSLMILDTEELKELFNNFLRMFSTFEFSYFDLIQMCFKQKRTIRNYEVKMDALVKEYGPFVAWVAILSFISSKDGLKGNFEALTMFAKINHLTINDTWENIKKSIDDLFFELNSYISKTGQDRKNAIDLFFAKKKIERPDRKIHFYDGFQDHVSEAFQLHFLSLNGFSNEIQSKIQLYFRAKIYGNHEVLYNPLIK